MTNVAPFLILLQIPAGTARRCKDNVSPGRSLYLPNRLFCWTVAIPFMIGKVQKGKIASMISVFTFRN